MENEALGKRQDPGLAEQTVEELRAALEQEIIKRQDAEKKLQHAQHVQNVFQRTAHLGSWEVDLNTGLLNCSDEFFRICGLEPQSKAIDIGFTQRITHPDDLELTAGSLKSALEKRKPYLIEKRIIRPDNTIRHVLSQGEIFFNEQQEVEAAIGSFHDITELKQAEEALRCSNEELRRLTAYQEKIREEERKRIAGELHDELGGLLTGMRAYITMSMERGRHDSRQTNELLTEATKIVDSALDSIRRIVNDLRPSILDHLGVWAAIEWYTERTALQAQIDSTCDIGDSVRNTALSPESGIMLFRIIQEAITNVVRHSRATRLAVSASLHKDKLYIEIQDNGKGFDEEKLIKRDSWGVCGMRERARQLDSEFKIVYVAGKGTTVTLHIPIEEERRAGRKN